MAAREKKNAEKRRFDRSVIKNKPMNAQAAVANLPSMSPGGQLETPADFIRSFLRKRRCEIQNTSIGRCLFARFLRQKLLKFLEHTLSFVSEKTKVVSKEQRSNNDSGKLNL